MSTYVAFPAHLVEELLALLPSNERPVYGERFEKIVGDLIWVQEDAEKAVEAALANSDIPHISALRENMDVRRALVAELLEAENDALVTLVQDGLATLASDLITRCLRVLEGASPRPESNAGAAAGHT